MATRLVQACAYANWTGESFEVWKWFRAGDPRKKISRELRSLFPYIFSLVVTSKTSREIAQLSFTVAGTDIELTVQGALARNLLGKVYYAWYVGRCLDKERLQYFAPEKVLENGEAVILPADLKIRPYGNKVPSKIDSESAKMQFQLRELSVKGSFMGTKNELEAVVEVARARKIESVVTRKYSLDDINQGMGALGRGEILGRAYVSP